MLWHTLISAAVFLASGTSAVKPWPKPTAPNYWFSFGDSYTQTGFNVTTGPLPVPGNPLGNPPYPGYTAVGGTNWIDVATVEYNHSLVLTYNFAYGGATIDASLVTPYLPTVLSLTDQINIYLNSVASKPKTTPWTSADSLFSIWIGVNDIGNSYYEAGDRSAFSDVLLDAYFKLVQKLYNTGARNFLFLNVPAIDRSPLMLAEPAASQATEASVIKVFNQKLAKRVKLFEATHFGTRTWIWDSNAVFTTILNNPTKYGFVNNATAFGEPGDFWGNNYHPSSQANEIFGKDIGKLLAGTPW